MRARPGLVLLSLLAFVPAARADVAADVERLIQTPFYEGMPQDAVDAIGPAACPHLIAALADPAAARGHGSAIEALGMLRCVGGFEALTAYAASIGAGEVDRATFRALRACPFAIGRLAATDDRALAWLMARAGTPGARAAAPAWHFRNRRGARLAGDERRRAVQALALSGRPEAATRLRALRADPVVRTPAREGLERMEAGGAR